MIRNTFYFLFTVLLTFNAFGAKNKYNEKYYQQKHCKGILEYHLKDKTRVDCLTSKYVIEFEWANKYFEAIGQSLHYARLTNKKPAIALILKKDSDMTYYNKLIDIIIFHDLKIKVFIIKGEN